MHILGMAKSHMDLRGAKRPKLELDFLRIAFAISHVDSAGEAGRGFLLVFTQQIRETAMEWTERYGTGDAIEIILAELTNDETRRLREEKISNVSGMIAGTLGQNVRGMSNADIGKEIGERKLEEEIRRRHPQVRRIADRDEYPLGIDWDFYGRT